MARTLRITTGQFSFESGVESGKTTTIASSRFPSGVKPNQLCWLTNGTVRGGGISNRTGYQPIVQGVTWSGLYQGGYLHEPDAADPHLILSIGGRIYQVRVDTDNSVRDLSADFGLTNPPDIEQGFFRQGELWTIIQAGDYVTKPLFWDGTTLRRSNGITGNATPIAPGNPGPGINELPPAGPMDYYMARLWYAFGRTYCAGDIVKGPSGTDGPPYYRRDSILRVTESPVGAAGDGFTVPTNAGNVRAIFHTSELDTALGEGRLYIGTRRSIYRLNVPITRADWINTDNDLKQPFQTVAQVKTGPVNDRSVVRVNGDVFYQTLLPSIASLALSIRNFGQWGNKSISNNENRVLRFNDRALLRGSTGIEFQNRVLQSALPYQSPVGIAHRGIIPLDLEIITSLQEDLPPAWEGMDEGLDVLQLFEGDFGGLQRAFAVILSRRNGQIEVWEITQAARTDSGDNRIQRYFETPSFTWEDSGSSTFELKELETLELWYDKLYGTVEFEVYFRPDQHPCWIPWHAWKECAARDCSEDLDAVSCDYPTTPYCEQYRATKTLPKPPTTCATTNHRGVNLGYQFQIKIVTKGTNRIRGLLVHALPYLKAPFEGIVCSDKLFYNIAFTSVCPAGFTCEPVTIPAGRYFSPVSQADADSKAIAVANQITRRSSVPISYPNEEQTVYCPSGTTGDPVTIPWGAFTSTSSQTAANALAVAAGEAALVCTPDPDVFYNVEYIASCGSGFTGDPVTIPAATYSSLIDQATADALAVAAGDSALVCVAITYDSFESYGDGTDLNTLNGGTSWNAAWGSRGTAPFAYDSFQSYADGADLSGLADGVAWSADWVSRSGAPAPLDNFQSYTDTADLNGLNGGSNWAGAWTSRP